MCVLCRDIGGSASPSFQNCKFGVASQGTKPWDRERNTSDLSLSCIFLPLVGQCPACRWQPEWTFAKLLTALNAGCCVQATLSLAFRGCMLDPVAKRHIMVVGFDPISNPSESLPLVSCSAREISFWGFKPTSLSPGRHPWGFLKSWKESILLSPPFLSCASLEGCQCGPNRRGGWKRDGLRNNLSVCLSPVSFSLHP